MIKLSRLKLPETVNQKIVKFRSEFRTMANVPWNSLSDKLKSAYQNLGIKEHLQLETNNKCAYCESRFTSTSFGDIEHIIEKSKHPELSVEHENMTFSCSCCNNSKNKYRNSNMKHINPFLDDPSEHLFALGCTIFGYDDLGDATQIIFDLNRAQLLEDRKEKITILKAYLDRYKTEKDETKRFLIHSLIMDIISIKSEYSFVMSSFFVYYTNRLGMEITHA